MSHSDSRDTASTSQREGTVCFIQQGENVFLALIEYGPGDQKWNGIGGFLEPGEMPRDAVVRELKEEVNISVDPTQLKLGAIIDVSPLLKLHVYVANNWNGEYSMKDTSLKEVRWFRAKELPYAQMHEGNERWLPAVLSGTLIRVTNNSVREVTSLEE